LSTILVVEDEDFFRDILINVLKKKNYEVHGCGDGKTAQHVLGMQNFDLVISDINMPSITGIQLAEWMKENHPTIPLVLMTGFSDILETQEAFALGVKEFLTKPFQQGALIQIVDKILNPSEIKSAPEIDLDSDFCKIRMEDFVSGTKIPYGIYIRLSKSKYIQIGHKGEDISRERIQSYKSKNVDYLYMTKEDFGNYVNFSVNLSHIVANSPKVSKQKKLGFLKYTNEVIMENTFVNGLDQQSFDQANDFMRNTLDVISSRDDAMNLLMMLNSHADFLYAHSLGVSLYAVMIGRQAGWTAPRTVFTLATAALFHDIGKKEIDLRILKKPRFELNQEERATYETHTIRGYELLSQIRGIPDSVATVAHQHHEDINGYGFPRKLTRSKINTIAKLINVANAFCENALKSPWNPGMSGPDALKAMNQTKKDALDPQFMFLLHQIFSVDFKTNKDRNKFNIEADPLEFGDVA